MAPVCWLMGVPWPQAVTAGSLMGIKTMLNELIAYVDLAKLPPDALDPRSRLIMLYAMCGFANFGSLGIMIGGLGTMAPERRDEINVARPEVDRLGHADDVSDGRGGGGVDVGRHCAGRSDEQSRLRGDRLLRFAQRSLTFAGRSGLRITPTSSIPPS